MKVTSIPETADDRTPASVLAVKEFKNKLLRNDGLVNARDVIDSEVKLPAIKLGTSHLSEETEMELQEFSVGEPTTSEENQIRTTFSSPMQALSDYLEVQPSKEEIKILGDFGKLSFKAVNVSINEFGVAFIVRKDAFQFEPNINTNLKVLYKDTEYDVVYAGGFFTFAKMPFTFVSFLRIAE